MAGNANFAVFSVVTRPESGYSNSDQITGGGLSIKGPSSGSFEPVIASISPNSGKWYWEYRAGQGGGSSYGRPAIGTSNQTVVKNEDYMGGASGQVGVLFTVNDGGKRISGSDSSYGNAVSQNDIVQIALDCDNGAVYLGINNTWQNSGNPESGASKTGAALTSGIQNVDIDIIHTRYNGGGIDQYNFGQDDTFGGAITAAGNADGNGHGVFKYAPPTGFLALCTANLSVSSDIDPAGDDGTDENPTKQFGVVTYTGNATTGQAITGLGFQPDLVWAKMTSSSQSNFLSNTSRGINKFLFSDLTNAEGTGGGYDSVYSSFDSDGFTFSTSGSGPNDSGREYVAWCWKAGGATTATNSAGAGATPTSGSVKIDGSNLGSALAGTIPANTISANTKAGFSIIDYTGSGSNGTVAHGLNNAPAFVLVKKYSASGNNWCNFHQGLASASTSRIFFTTGGRQSIGSGTWNSTVPSSSVISLGTNGNVNTSGADYLIYAWSEIEGYSKFSSYIGNGNNDGPFVYTGFRPRMIVFKWVEGGGASAEPWGVFDTVRATYNPTSAHSDSQVYWNTTGAASQGSTHGVDFLSNGFKLRGNGGLNNFNGASYIYGAWGDVPFKYNNTF